MNIEWHKKAEKEFLDLPETVQKEIKTQIERLPEEGTGWDKVELIIREKIGFKAYRLKIAPDDNDNLNHRIIFDIVESNYEIYKIGKRPGFYDKDNLKEIEKRT
jgi:mRNA-degrading endonuclease RelE of RelBE toxin-antitoxin system